MNKLKRGLAGWIQDNKIGASFIGVSILLVIAAHISFFVILFKNYTQEQQNVSAKTNVKQESDIKQTPSKKIKKLENQQKKPISTTNIEFKEVSDKSTSYLDKGNEKIDKWSEQMSKEGLENVTYFGIESAFNEYSDSAELLLSIEPPDEYVLEYNELISINNDYMNSIKYYNEAVDNNSTYSLIEAAKLKSRADNKLEDFRNK